MKSKSPKRPRNEENLTTKSRIDAILARAEAACQKLNPYGYPIAPYHDTTLEALGGADDETLTRIETDLASVEKWTLAMQQHTAGGQVDDVKLLRRGLALLDLTTDEENFTKIASGDIVEVYNLDFIQIYRNFEFMKLSSYSLLDVAGNEFYRLYERSSLVNDQLFSAARQVAADPKAPLDARILVPTHPLREKFSPKRREFFVTFKYILPVFVASGPRQGKMNGYLTIQSGTEVPENMRGKIDYI